MYDVRNSQIENLAGIYTDVFGDRTDGVFVEVGANDGVAVSNTRALVECGWSGLYIEPVHSIYVRCADNCKKYPNVKVLNYAISSKEGDGVVFNAGLFSTIEKKNIEMMLDAKFYVRAHQASKEETCKLIRLDTLLKQQNIPANFELLVVDTEGTEPDVFNSFDLQEYAPKMLIVELEEGCRKYRKQPDKVQEIIALRNYISNCGYKDIYKDAINTVFVRG